VNNQNGLRGARRLLLLQLGASVIAALMTMVIFGSAEALSALLGGVVSALPNAYFARKLFQYQGARAARQIVNSFYKGEAVKIILSIVLFALVFAFCNVIPWIFFATYIGAQMLMWFAPLVFVNNERSRS